MHYWLLFCVICMIVVTILFLLVLLTIGIIVVITHLVGGLEHVVFFPFSWEFHHPN